VGPLASGNLVFSCTGRKVWSDLTAAIQNNPSSKKPVDPPAAIPYHSQLFHQEWRRDWPNDATATGFEKDETTRCQFQV
jgi:hypothetical protein